VGAPLAFAEDDLKDKQKKVERKIDRAEDSLQESSASAARAARQLSAAQGRLDRARAKLSRTRGKLAAAEARDRLMQEKLEKAVAALAQAREELRKGRAAVERQRGKVDDTVAAMYEGGGGDMAMLTGILESRGLDDMTWAMSSSEAISDEQKADLESLQAAEVLLELRKGRVADKKDQVAAQRRAAAQNLRLRQRLEARAEREAGSVASLVSERASAARAAGRAKARDRAILDALRRENDRIEAMLKKRAEEARRRAGASKSSKPGSSGGYLDYPVNGYVTSPYGYRTHPIYGYYSLHDGVDFGSGCGSPLYASASGRVVSRYYSSVYGNRLVLDHGYQRGVGLASIYNHASTYTVGSGSYVQRGQVIGYVGSTGWSTGCHLHFTVTVNGNTTDPMKWF
jgi:murein DD-endopeptidase MepM/ murein hydrolase activator NlpD